jgi:excisionase family DNA binding protein
VYTVAVRGPWPAGDRRGVPAEIPHGEGVVGNAHVSVGGVHPVETLEQDRLLRTAEVAELLALSQRAVYRLAEDGILQPVRLRGAVRFRASDIQRLIASGAEGTAT